MLKITGINKLSIRIIQLARKEEQISKAKAVDLFENELLKNFEVGTFKRLGTNTPLFSDIYDFLSQK